MSAGEHFELREDKVWFERFGASRSSLLFRMKTKVPPLGTSPTSFHTTLPLLMPLATLPLMNPVVFVFFLFLFLLLPFTELFNPEISLPTSYGELFLA